MTEPQEPRPKRFQFSLRTLMLCVLAYGGLWLITTKWGASQLSKSLANEPSESSYIEIRRGDQVTRIKGRRSSETVGVASAPVPLIVIWRPDSRRVNEWTAYFWFFGYTQQVYKTPIQSEEPPLKGNPEKNDTNEKNAN